MKHHKSELRKLQEEWYDKLAAHGFEDIEKIKGDELVLIQTAASPYRNEDEFSRKMKEEYFRRLAQAVHHENVVFKNDVHRYILLRRAEGAQIKTIRSELISQGLYRCRRSIRCIIRRYEMIWGIRDYEPNELNIYIKKRA